MHKALCTKAHRHAQPDILGLEERKYDLDPSDGFVPISEPSTELAYSFAKARADQGPRCLKRSGRRGRQSRASHSRSLYRN